MPTTLNRRHLLLGAAALGLGLAGCGKSDIEGYWVGANQKLAAVHIEKVEKDVFKIQENYLRASPFGAFEVDRSFLAVKAKEKYYSQGLGVEVPIRMSEDKQSMDTLLGTLQRVGKSEYEKRVEAVKEAAKKADKFKPLF